jgi:2-polyprenyl-6-hydroxyphenyl methylase/3-demethylubiquinone-9 3-methyltransferase
VVVVTGNDRHLIALDPNTAEIDNEYYHDVGDAWWDAESGPLRALHDMNPARVSYFDTTAREIHRRPASEISVLDIGCGGGLVSEALARLGYRVTGIDLSAESVKVAQRHAAAAGVRVDYRVGSAYDLPNADASVDVVVISDVLEHLHDLPAAVAEIARVLRPGGVVGFDTINRTLRSYLVAILVSERLLKIIHPGTHNWRMFIRPEELRRLFARHGLRLSEVHGLAPAAAPPKLVAALLRGERLGQFTLTRSPAVSYIGHAVKEK